MSKTAFIPSVPAASEDDFEISAMSKLAGYRRFFGVLKVVRTTDGRVLFPFDGAPELGPYPHAQMRLAHTWSHAKMRRRTAWKQRGAVARRSKNSHASRRKSDSMTSKGDRKLCLHWNDPCNSVHSLAPLTEHRHDHPGSRGLLIRKPLAR